MSQEEYARYRLTAKYGNVRLEAQSITDEHKEETLAVWHDLGATDITCTPVTPVKHLTRYAVDYVLSGRTNTKCVIASSEKAAASQVRHSSRGRIRVKSVFHMEPYYLSKGQ